MGYSIMLLLMSRYSLLRLACIIILDLFYSFLLIFMLMLFALVLTSWCSVNLNLVLNPRTSTFTDGMIACYSYIITCPSSCFFLLST